MEITLETRHTCMLEACVKKKIGSIISVLTSNASIFDSDFDLNSVDCEFIPDVGDDIKLLIEIANGTKKVTHVQPNEKLNSHIGYVTHLAKDSGLVDNKIVFFIDDQMKYKFSLNDHVQCNVIHGEYYIHNSKFDSRCETIKKIENLKQTQETVEQNNVIDDDNWSNGTCDKTKMHEENDDNEKMEQREKVEDNAEKGKNEENEVKNKINNNDENVSTIYYELNAIIDRLENTELWPLTSDPSKFEDKIDLTQIDYGFKPYKGDSIKLIIAAETPVRVVSMEPLEELRGLNGKITYMTKSFGTVDDDFVFFIDETVENMKFQLNDQVQCVIIDGEYDVGRSRFESRCEMIKKIDEISKIDQWFQDKSEENEIEKNDIEKVDADESVIDNNDPQMQFEAFPKREPIQEFYDLPYGLYETIQSKNIRAISRKLHQMVPAKLNYKTYKTRHHALIYLEEVEMKISFDKYKSREIWIEPDNKRFSIMCSKITELRPPIAVGDKIEVRNINYPRTYYRGIVERVRPDRFILKFRKDFNENYRIGDIFSAEFFYSRVLFMRKHAAVEYAKQKLSEEFLFPKQLTLANKQQINAIIQDGKLIIDGKQVSWFKEELNDEQKEAVAAALRGECRPFPFIIFGPPGTGKTSTLIEIICQLYTHISECKILIATQSNHAANVVASRLLASNSKMSPKLLRLVSNTVLDRKNLPKELHKVSASVLNSFMGDFELNDAHYDDISKDIKRNCNLNYLARFQIIIGTCVGLGILFNSDFSDKYFTHVIIDEAAQCSECEAMIPISCINTNDGQIIMAGDPLQLPPISLSIHARHHRLITSMLERYIDTYKIIDGIEVSDGSEFDPRLVVRLRRNYRALPCIVHYYNNQFYKSALIPIICGSTSKEALLLGKFNKLLPHCTNNHEQKPFGITFVNVEGRNVRLDNKKSWENMEERHIIQDFLKYFLGIGVAQEDIGIITPYHAQVIALKKALHDLAKRIRVGTVEEFQGEEKMIIMFSAVKTSGTNKALEFIYCPKRLNTAISRARMLVIVFGKVSLLQGDENWNALIEYCRSNGALIEGKTIIQKL